MIYGIDIGGTKIELGAFDATMEQVWRRRVETPISDYARLLDAVANLVERADSELNTRAPIGVGMPGLVDAEGRSFCANLPCANGKQVQSDLAMRLGCPVVVANDTRLFALSEARGGAGDAYRRVFGAVLGTGAAAGLVIDGTLECGSHGIAGEYGHLPLSASLQQAYALPLIACPCGLVGCTEAYVAGPGLLQLGRHFGVDAKTSQDVASAWRAGQANGRKAYACLLDLLGSSFANVVKLIDPDIIVIGGGLSELDELIADLPVAIAKHLFAGFPVAPVVAARFGGTSGARGAALLACDAATKG